MTTVLHYDAIEMYDDGRAAVKAAPIPRKARRMVVRFTESGLTNAGGIGLVLDKDDITGRWVGVGVNFYESYEEDYYFYESYEISNGDKYYVPLSLIRNFMNAGKVSMIAIEC